MPIALRDPNPDEDVDAIDRWRAERVLAGDAWRAELEPANLTPLEARDVVARAAARTARREFAPPLHLLVADNVTPLDRAPRACGGECADGKRVCWRWHPSARVTGGRILHGYAHCLLCREGVPHNEAAVWLVTGELALAVAAAWRILDLEEIVRRQRYAPRWLLAAQHAHALAALAAEGADGDFCQSER
jgi:hypothetical protein